MIINQSNLHGLTTGYSAAFNKALSEVSPDYKDIATVTSSSTAANDYAWLGQIPGMKEWIGDREVQHISEYTPSRIRASSELSASIEMLSRMTSMASIPRCSA